MNITQHVPELTASRSCREFLNCIYQKRSKKNPKYSLRSLARDLKVSPSTLCLLFQDKRKISAKSAGTISKNLPVTENELEHWHSLVFLEQALNSETEKHLLYRQDFSKDSLAQQNQISLDHFHSLSEWQHLALMSATELSPQLKNKDLAYLLNISSSVANESIARLLRLGLLQVKAQKLIKTHQVNNIRSQNRNEALREYHLSMLQKTAEAIRSQDNTKKFTGTLTLAIDPRQMDEFQDMFRSFVRKVIRVADKGKKKQRIYHMSLNFFDLFDGRSL